MKKKLIIGLVCCMCQISFAQLKESIIGTWQDTEDPERRIEFYLDSNNQVAGRIPINTNHEHSGKSMFKDLQYNSSSDTFQAIMTPPDRDVEVNATVYYLSNNEIKIIGKKFLFKKTIILERLTTND